MLRSLLVGLPAVFLLALVALVPGERQTSAGVAPQLIEIFPNVNFNRLVDIDFIPRTSDRYLVVEQGGVVSKLKDGQPNNKTKIADLSGLVTHAGEEGLLGLAFDPAYNPKVNKRVYVYYTADEPRRGVLARYDYNGRSLRNRQVLFAVRLASGHANHNGGGLHFGPDNLLYLSVGDGGAGGAVAQDINKLPGKVIRLDVSGQNARIPTDNPFYGPTPGRGSIFAYGFRNPWRFSFDSATGDLWLGDVGQQSWEEINVVDSGENYGWNSTEGPDCFSPPTGCNRSGLTDPVAYYSSSSGGECAITGGYVYRGSAVPSLVGDYVFGDYCTGEIRSTPAASPGPFNSVAGAGFGLVSFGVDKRGEIIAVYQDGLFRLQ